jgi:hypothetical protein
MTREREKSPPTPEGMSGLFLRGVQAQALT